VPETALQIALDRAERLEAIPTITHPLGRSWTQPSRRGILIDDKYAVISLRDFEALKEYSCSQPSGVYEGKMWKRHDGAFDPRCRPEDRRWLLCWYGYSNKPDCVSNNYREILLTDGEFPA
jgi:hypothetical protein